MVNGSAAKKGVEQGRSADLEQAILRALEKSSSGAGTFTGKGSGARRRAIRRFRNLTGHEGDVLSVALDGQRIVSGSSDNTIKVWDLETGALLHTLTGHEGSVLSVALDGQRIVSGSQDNTVKVWDLETGAELQLFFDAASLLDFVVHSFENFEIVHEGLQQCLFHVARQLREDLGSSCRRLCEEKRHGD